MYSGSMYIRTVFTAVYYGDLIPTSGELQHILGFAQKEEQKQCVILHLAASLVHSEVGSKRPPPPASRVRLMAKSLRLLGAKQAREIQDSTPQASARRGGGWERTSKFASRCIG